VEDLEAEGRRVGVLERREVYGPDLSGLQEMALYGLKGLAAYAEHAFVLGQESDEVFAFCHEALAKLSRKNEQTLEGLLQLSLDVGKVNVEVMRLLDLGATTRYGHPKPTPVRTTAVKGKCALVSGHDLRDLEELLKQTEGKGINVYTHGEMLPAHGYPGLKEKYPHLVGTCPFLNSAIL
jgi:hydroxylamine reductase